MQITYKNGSITPEELVTYLALTGRLSVITAELVRQHETIRKAGELGLSVSDENLQSAADSFRNVNGLYKASDMTAFLDSAGITLDNFEQFCEASLLQDALKEYLANDNTVEEYFVNNRGEFDYARISEIVVAEEGLARELVLRIEEDGDDFHVLAREFSTADSKYGGGYVGLVNRPMLPPEIAAKAFNASAGDVTGPFPTEGGFRLILVEERITRDLDNQVKTAIKDRIFVQWSQSHIQEGIRVIPD